jgi:hypothetical protein
VATNGGPIATALSTNKSLLLKNSSCSRQSNKKPLPGYSWREGYLPKRSFLEIVKVVDREIKLQGR